MSLKPSKLKNDRKPKIEETNTTNPYSVLFASLVKSTKIEKFNVYLTRVDIDTAR